MMKTKFVSRGLQLNKYGMALNNYQQLNCIEAQVLLCWCFNQSN